MVGDEALDGFAEVVPAMPSVCSVLGLRGAGAGTVGEERGAVAADDLDARVLAQSGGQGLRLAVGQQVQRLVGLAVDQDRAVPAALAGRELVHSQHPRHRPGRLWQRHHHAQHGHPADHDAQHHPQPDHGASGQDDTKSTDDPLQGARSPTVAAGVSPSTCSAKVPLVQSRLSQNSRRTDNPMSTGRTKTGASAILRP